MEHTDKERYESEVWRIIAGNIYYDVSNFGRIRSWKKWNGKPTPRLLSLQTDTKGYKEISMEGNEGTRMVHRIVLEAFIGPCPDYMECCHGDGNRTNNHIDNLRWDTPKNNTEDKRTHGTLMMGENHANSKISDEQVIEMRRLREEEGWSYNQLEHKYNLSNSQVGAICTYQQRKNTLPDKELFEILRKFLKEAEGQNFTFICSEFRKIFRNHIATDKLLNEVRREVLDEARTICRKENAGFCTSVYEELRNRYTPEIQGG